MYNFIHKAHEYVAKLVIIHLISKNKISLFLFLNSEHKI